VALGTVADVAPLMSENRIFVRHGLDVLNRTKRRGLKSLIEAAGIGAKKISTHSISFMLAPRLNASGRVDSAHASLDLLLSDDEVESKRLAGYLNEHNRSRQQLEGKVLEQAMDQIDREVNFEDDFIIVLSRDDWHPGVLGIVASKIVDRYYRPAIVISLQDEFGRGSARSVPNFHIYEALCQCESYLKEFGGHKYAAGLTIHRDNIDAFRKVLNGVARDFFKKETVAPVLEVDAQIPMAMANAELMEDIDRLSPYGEGNRRPLFISRGLLVKSRPSIVGKNTLKFWVSDGEVMHEAVGFGLGDLRDLVISSARVDLVYALGWDTWNEDRPVQLEIKDIKQSQV
jgi:single-stranded-DNA-specific exonuclease